MEEIYDQGIINGVEYKVVYSKVANQYVFTAGEEETYFNDTYTLNNFLDRLDSFTWECAR